MSNNYANFRKAKAIETANKKRWLEVNPSIPDTSGIYVMTRTDGLGFRYAYVGQAKHILTRLAQHLTQYDMWIDKSLKKHGLYNAENNPYGWQVSFQTCAENDLNERERLLIKLYAEYGYQLRNKTLGGQNEGKHGIAENAPSKGYFDGVKYGYERARKFVAKLFEQNLKAEINGKDGVRKQKAMEKFLEFIAVDEKGESDNE